MKVDAGARFLQLQIGYGPEVLESFMEGCRANGVTDRSAVMPTVILTKSAGALRFMESSVPGIHVPQAVIDRVANAENPSEESFELVREQVQHALSLQGVAGVHITDFRHDGSLERLVSELAIGPSSARASAHSA